MGRAQCECRSGLLLRACGTARRTFDPFLFLKIIKVRKGITAHARLKGAYHPRNTKIHINYRFPLIIQGGLEIPVEVTVEMDISEENV